MSEKWTLPLVLTCKWLSQDGHSLRLLLDPSQEHGSQQAYSHLSFTRRKNKEQVMAAAENAGTKQLNLRRLIVWIYTPVEQNHSSPINFHHKMFSPVPAITPPIKVHQKNLLLLINL